MSHRILRASLIASLFFCGGQMARAGTKEIRVLEECSEKIGVDPNLRRSFVIPPGRQCGEKDLYPSRMKIYDLRLGIVLVRTTARGSAFTLKVIEPQKAPEETGVKTCVDVDPDATRIMEWIVRESESCVGRASGAVLVREYRADIVEGTLVPTEVCLMPHDKCIAFDKLTKAAQDEVRVAIEPARKKAYEIIVARFAR